MEPVPAPAAPELPLGLAVALLLGLFLAILMAGMDALVVNTALPTIAVDLHQTNGITFVVGAYLISSTVSIPLFSKLSDLYSRRNVFLVGLGIFIVGSLLSGLSQNLNELIAFRGLQGFGSGGFLPVGIAMVTVLFPPRNRARITGLLAGAGGISIAVGPLLGSYIIDVTTWRWVFYVNLPFGLAAAAVLLLGVGPLRPDARGRFDLGGAALLSTWVAALMFPLIEITDAGWSWSDPRTVGLLGVALVAFVAFVLVELRASEPVVPLRLLGRPVLAATGGVGLLNGVVLTSALTFLAIFVGFVILHEGPGSANDIRDITYFFAIPLISGAAVGGLLLSRFSYRTVVAPALLVAALATTALASISATTPLWEFRDRIVLVGGLVLPLIPMGLGMGIALSGALIVVQNEAGAKEVGGAIGFVRFLQSLGGAVGLSLLTAYQEWRLQVHETGVTTAAGGLSALAASYDDVFVATAALLFVAFLCSLFLRGRVPAAAPRASLPV
jgi:EmrB/QacA subfamily drug resistance transporter